MLRLTLKDRRQESWLASPAVGDLEGNGKDDVVMRHAQRVRGLPPLRDFRRE